MTTRTFAPLTDAETAALVAFAREYGPQWKARLLRLWHTASATPTLHCLRNSHGPEWLVAFQMEQPARIVTGGRVVVERGCKAIGWRKGAWLTVERIDDATVTLTAESVSFAAHRSRAMMVTGGTTLCGMTTALRSAEGMIEVRALGCEQPDR